MIKVYFLPIIDIFLFQYELKFEIGLTLISIRLLLFRFGDRMIEIQKVDLLTLTIIVKHLNETKVNVIKNTIVVRNSA